MLSLRNRFGIPGVISVLALVFALVAGGAYAATDGAGTSAKNKRAKNKRGKQGGLNGKQKRQVIQLSRREARRFQGTGPVGPQGFPGIPGPEGPKGDDGDDGSDGSDGSDGKEGPAGDSVIVANESPENCPNEEGVTYEVEGTGELNEVCNGEPGSFDPEGFTQTGTYTTPTTVEGLSGGTIGEGESFGPMPASFTIPLESAPDFVFVPGPEETEPGGYGAAPGSGCPGVVGGVPQADPGKFCVYGFSFVFFVATPSADVTTLKPDSAGDTTEEGVTPAGTLLEVTCNEGNEFTGTCMSRGVWAVTG